MPNQNHSTTSHWNEQKHPSNGTIWLLTAYIPNAAQPFQHLHLSLPIELNFYFVRTRIKTSFTICIFCTEIKFCTLYEHKYYIPCRLDQKVPKVTNILVHFRPLNIIVCRTKYTSLVVGCPQELKTTPIWLFRDEWHHQNRWIFGKVQNGL